MAKATRRLKNFDFSGDNAAVALVNEDQGGGANGYKTLLMKAKDVRVELSMEEFLRRFFDMWWDDAELLAGMLGYETEYGWEDEWGHPLKDSVTLLKNVKDNGVSSIEEKDQPIAKAMAQEIAKRVNVKLSDVSAEDMREALAKNFKHTTKGEHMSEETLTRAQVEQMLAEQIEKAQSSAKDETKAEYEEIVKGLKAEIEKFQEKEQQIQKAKYVEKAKGYEALGVTDDNAEDAAVALMKMAEDEELKVIGEMLEKALNIAKAAQGGAFDEQGHDLEVDADDDFVQYMKSKYQDSK